MVWRNVVGLLSVAAIYGCEYCRLGSMQTCLKYAPSPINTRVAARASVGTPAISHMLVCAARWRQSRQKVRTLWNRPQRSQAKSCHGSHKTSTRKVAASARGPSSARFQNTITTTPQRTNIRRANHRSSMVSKRSAGLPFDAGYHIPVPRSGRNSAAIEVCLHRPFGVDRDHGTDPKPKASPSS